MNKVSEVGARIAKILAEINPSIEECKQISRDLAKAIELKEIWEQEAQDPQGSKQVLVILKALIQ